MRCPDCLPNPTDYNLYMGDSNQNSKLLLNWREVMLKLAETTVPITVYFTSNIYSTIVKTSDLFYTTTTTSDIYLTSTKEYTSISTETKVILSPTTTTEVKTSLTI